MLLRSLQQWGRGMVGGGGCGQLCKALLCTMMMMQPQQRLFDSAAGVVFFVVCDM